MKYYVSRGGQQYGPYTLADLQRYVASGNILSTDLACPEGGSQWVPVSQVLGNMGVQAPQPQQPVQPAAPRPAAPQNYGQGAGSYGVQGSAAPAYAPVAYGMDYATWATRALGYIIDSLFVMAAMAVLYLVAGALTAVIGLGSRDMAGGMCCIFLGIFPVATLLVGLYNRVYLVSLRGYSVGQGVMKVKVVDASGNLLTRNSALIRLLAQIGMGFVPLLPVLDLLWPLWDERRQTLHDKAVGSYVINNAAAR